MRFLARRHRDRVADALSASYERLLPANPDRFDARQIVRDYCQPIKCDIKDNYVCAAHRVAP